MASTLPRSIIIVSYHFYPSNEIGARRVTALAQFLASKGIRVIVVSEFGGAAIARGAEILPGVIAIPVKQPKQWLIGHLVKLKRSVLPDNGAEDPNLPIKPSVARERRGIIRSVSVRMRHAFFEFIYFVDRYKRWAWHASNAAHIAGRQFHAQVLLSSGPPMTALVSGALAARRLRIPWIADIRDPMTEYPLAGGKRRLSLESRLLLALEHWVADSAAAITCTTSGLAGWMVARYPGTASRTHTVRNGFDGAVRNAPAGTNARLNMLYAGEIYANRDPFPVLEALERLLGRPDVDSNRISLTFVGNCESYDGRSLAKWTRSKRSESIVRILPPVSSVEVQRHTENATLLLNFTQGWPVQVPAKTYEQLASGREILVLCEAESETARIVDPLEGVTRVDPRDDRELDRALYDVYRRHVNGGRLNAPQQSQVLQYSREFMNAKFLEILQSVTEK
jgi:hypothetical protein